MILTPAALPLFHRPIAWREDFRAYGYSDLPAPSVSRILDVRFKGEGLEKWKIRKSLDGLIDRIRTKKPDTIPQVRALAQEAVEDPYTFTKTAGSFGDVVHGWIKTYTSNGGAGSESPRPPMPTDPIAVRCIEAMLGWEKANDVLWLASEHLLVYDDVKGDRSFVGKPDNIAILRARKRVAIIDWKTADRIFEDSYLEVTGFALALRSQLRAADAWPDVKKSIENPDRIIVRLDKATGRFDPQDVPTKLDRDARAFLGLRDAWGYNQYAKQCRERAASRTGRTANAAT